jgi:hypothetical protein
MGKKKEKKKRKKKRKKRFDLRNKYYIFIFKSVSTVFPKF